MENSSLYAVDEICRSPALHAEACALVPHFEAMMTPAGPMGVKAVLGKLFAIYPQQDRSEPEWAAWWEAYIDDLGSLPLWALIDGAKEYRRLPTSEFFPKPGALRDLAGRTASKAVRGLSITRMASRQEPRRVIEAINAEERHQLAESIKSTFRKPIP